MKTPTTKCARRDLNYCSIIFRCFDTAQPQTSQRVVLPEEGIHLGGAVETIADAHSFPTRSRSASEITKAMVLTAVLQMMLRVPLRQALLTADRMF